MYTPFKFRMSRRSTVSPRHVLARGAIKTAHVASIRAKRQRAIEHRTGRGVSPKQRIFNIRYGYTWDKKLKARGYFPRITR